MLWVTDGKSAGAEFEKPDSAAADLVLSVRNTGPLGIGADPTPGQREDDSALRQRSSVS